MPNKTSFQSMSASDRYDLLRATAIKNRREPFVFEKDIWVVQILKILFDAPFGKDLVFKGGTSLSKAYNVIRWFSEDLDVTYDIRAFAPDIADDYEAMLRADMLFNDPEPFENIMGRCANIQTRANNF